MDECAFSDVEGCKHSLWLGVKGRLIVSWSVVQNFDRFLCSVVRNLQFLNVFLSLGSCEDNTCSARCSRNDIKMQNCRKKIRSRMGHYFPSEHFRAWERWERDSRQLWLGQTEFSFWV